MSNGSMPTGDEAFRAWSANVVARLTADAAAYFVASATVTDYTESHNAYSSALTAWLEPSTRTPGQCELKRSTKARLMREARVLMAQLRSNPLISNQLKVDIGLKIPKTPSSIGPPALPPVLRVKGRLGSDVDVVLSDATTGRRRKPDGVRTAALYAHVGPTAPSDPTQYVAYGNTGRTEARFSFPPELPAGTTVHLVACWLNAKGQAGPGCQPVTTFLAGGAMAMPG